MMLGSHPSTPRGEVHLKKHRKLAWGKPEGRAGPADIAKARLVAEAAKEVSRPDN